MSQKAADGCREEEMQEEIRENVTDGNVFPTCRASLALSVLSTLKLKVIRVKSKNKNKHYYTHALPSFSFQMSMKMTSERKSCGLLPPGSRAPSVQVRAGKSANIAQFPSYRPTVGEHGGRIGV